MSLKPVRSFLIPSRTTTRKLVGYEAYSPNGYVDIAYSGQPAYFKRLEFLDSVDDDVSGRGDKPCSHYLRAAEVYPEAISVYKYNHVLEPAGSGDYAIYNYDSPQFLWETGGSLVSPSGLLGPFADPAGSNLGALDVLKLYGSDGHGGYWIVDPPNLQDFSERAIAAMLPGIKPDMSFINFLIELKDVKSLIHTVRRLKELQKALKFFLQRKKLGIKGNPSLKRIARAAAADDYLQKEFNIQPFLRDVAQLYGPLQSLVFKISEILKREGLDQHRHFSVPLGDPYTDTSDSVFLAALDNNIDGQIEARRTVSYNEAKFHATLSYDFSLTELERKSAYARGLLDKFGVNFNPVIIWNAIPWTFVVDWILGVNQFLSNFSVRNIEPRCNIHTYCYSAQIDRTIETSLVFSGGYYQKPNTVLLARIREKAYKRYVPGSFDLSSSFRTSGLSPKEFSLAGALYFSGGHFTHNRQR